MPKKLVKAWSDAELDFITTERQRGVSFPQIYKSFNEKFPTKRSEDAIKRRYYGEERQKGGPTHPSPGHRTCQSPSTVASPTGGTIAAQAPATDSAPLDASTLQQEAQQVASSAPPDEPVPPSFFAPLVDPFEHVEMLLPGGTWLHIETFHPVPAQNADGSISACVDGDGRVWGAFEVRTWHGNRVWPSAVASEKRMHCLGWAPATPSVGMQSVVDQGTNCRDSSNGSLT